VGPPPRERHISKTTEGPKVNSFKSSITRFLVFRFIGQNQTSAIVRWLKMDFFRRSFHKAAMECMKLCLVELL
jgi:hypothetical protein